MIFTQPLYGKVLRGEKTETRRLVQAADLATKYRPGMRKAVQKGRGVHGEAHIVFTAVRRERLAALDFAAARAEGFRTVLDFQTYWLSLHDKAWLERREKLVSEGKAEPLTDEEILARFHERHAHKQVWVLTFAIDRTEQPRLLMQGSPLTEGGKARLMSNRRIERTPAGKKAKRNDITGPEAHGIASTSARALSGKADPGEAVDERTQEKFSREGIQGFIAREAQRELDRELLAAEDRLRLVRIEARAQGVDISQVEMVIRQRIREAERKVHRKKAA